jgi:hypothetical protein
MSEFPRQTHEVLIPKHTVDDMVYFQGGYPRFKAHFRRCILEELKKLYPTFDTVVEDEGAIIWFESSTPYISIGISLLAFTFAYFDPLGIEELQKRKHLTISRLNQQDVAELIKHKTVWSDKAKKETLRRMVFSVEGPVKHKRHLSSVFLDVLNRCSTR